MKTTELFDRGETLLLDGGMGTLLQASGALRPGERPELLAMTQPACIERIHAAYAAAGSRVLCADTFGASACKLAGSGRTPEEVITAAIAAARRAAAPYGALTALDIGPLGELLEPSGTFPYAQAIDEFARMVRAGVQAGADLIFLETFTDLYELKAALLAARENSALPVLASMSFEGSGRTFTGCSPEAFAVTARALGADAVGINCSLGPAEIYPIAVRLCAALPGDFPVFVKPNAGLPRADGSGYDITPQRFALEMKPYRALGLFAAGGCCGTTPETIRLLASAFRGAVPGRAAAPARSLLCSAVRCVEVSGITVVGERINPTGKKRFQQAVREGDTDYILTQAVAQAEAGAEILDVNVCVPGTDEPAMMERTVRALQSVVDLPLQLDSPNAAALERGLRVCSGRPIVNSVSGEVEKLAAILPLCKKYGAAVVGLTLDEKGIPETAEQRLVIARRIVGAALAAGLAREDIYIDCLTLTAGTQQRQAMETLEALRRCRAELGVRTVLGVSNISFGLPCRPYLNAAFLTLAMQAGLDLAILNPASTEMMAAVAAFRVLSGRDAQAEDYIRRSAQWQQAQAALPAAAAPAGQSAPADGTALQKAVRRGLRAEAAAETEALLRTRQPLEIVDGELIPALDAVGNAYDRGTLYLPQMLQAAAAAQSAFGVLKKALAERGEKGEARGTIVLATVKGDVHDIGKNIVHVVLENYGFSVIDLGRDVPPEAILAAVQKHHAQMAGLSALMTTTLGAMEQTIVLLHRCAPGVGIMVGGAVLTADYAAQIGADCYAENAKRAADLARAWFAAH